MDFMVFVPGNMLINRTITDPLIVLYVFWITKAQNTRNKC